MESDVHSRFVPIDPDRSEGTGASLAVRVDGGGKSDQVLHLLSIRGVCDALRVGPVSSERTGYCRAS